MDRQSTIVAPPLPALVLGCSGLAPFVLSLLVVLLGRPEWAAFAKMALQLYGAIILSFMGGAQWGLEMTRGGRSGSALAYGLSTLPALVGLAAALAPFRPGLVLLLIGFPLLLAYDLRRARDGVGPGWYPVLRIGLTAGVTLLLCCGLLLAPASASA